MPPPATVPSHRCNLCGGPADDLLVGEPTIVRCSSCGLVSLARFPPAAEREEAYQEEYYQEATGGRFLFGFELVARFFRRLRAWSILRRERGPASLLDVGCGRGFLLHLLQKRGWNVLGTQLSRTAARAARARWGVDVYCGALPDLDYRGEPFRVVTFFHVLEHLEDPEAYLRHARELLAPGGLLVVEVPNFASPGFRVLGHRNLCLDWPNHLVFFTPHSLGELLLRCGFDIEDITHFSLEYSPFTTLQNLLNLLPGEPNRLFRSLAGNREGRALRRSPLTWLHYTLAALLAAPAAALSFLLGVVLPAGNTIRFYARRPTAERAARKAKPRGAGEIIADHDAEEDS